MIKLWQVEDRVSKIIHNIKGIIIVCFVIKIVFERR